MNKFPIIVVLLVLIVSSTDALKKKKKKLLLGGVVVGGLAKLKLAAVAGLSSNLGKGSRGSGFGHDQPSYNGGYGRYVGGNYGSGGYGESGFGIPYNSAYSSSFSGPAYNPSYFAYSAPKYHGPSKPLYQSYYPAKSVYQASQCNPCSYKNKSPLYAGGWK